MRLVLASASPRRAELLRAAGYVFEVCSADVDERVHEGESPEQYVLRLAQVKASAVLRRVMNDAEAAGGERGAAADSPIVIGADTAVVVDRQILGKPEDSLDAERMLRLLSGRTHVVLTGLCCRRGIHEVHAVERTEVAMVPLTAQQVGWYVASREGCDKAGGYGVQGLASRFVSSISGSYSNVVGLPIARFDELIRRLESL